MQYRCTSCQKLNSKNTLPGEGDKCIYCNNAQQAPESPWSPDAILGFRYMVIQVIGRGGHGYVCLCRDLFEDHNCILKIFHHDSLTKEVIDSFYNEAQLARNLIHPNIVRTYGGSIDGKSLYIVQDWVCGLDLIHYEKKICRLTINQLMYILKTCCKALQYMWENHQLIHRDIKPENILLNHRGEVFIADFGIMATAKNLQGKKAFFCTPEYVDPESASGKGNIDFRSDIYSLGASFFRLISGHAPFKSDNTQELIMQRTSMAVPDLRTVCDVSEEVAGLIYKMMQISIDDRYQSYDELIDAIAYTTMTQNEDLHDNVSELEKRAHGK